MSTRGFPSVDDQMFNYGANPSIVASPFNGRFDTNANLTHEELQQLREIVSSAESELEPMNAEISRLEQKISFLRDKTSPIARLIENREALTNPILRLPTEMMQEIFARCLPEDGQPPGSMRPQDFPMVLTLVCRSWREIALNTPVLWSKLHFPLSSHHSQAYNDPVCPRSTGVQRWLRRSGSTPLSISIVQLEVGRPDDRSNLHNDIFPLLRPHSRRWKHLYLTATVEQAAPFFDIDPDDLPHLVSAHIHFLCSPSNAYDDTIQNQNRIYDRFYASGVLRNPALRELVLSSWKYNSGNIAPSCLVVWENLTTLILDEGFPFGNMYSLFCILTRTQRLEALHLHLSPPYAGRPSSACPSLWSDIITVPCLKRLRIVESIPALEFVEYIRFPALESLAYSPYTDPDPRESNRTLLTLLEHSGAHIETLATPPYAPSTSLLLSYLRHCPQLRTLFLVARTNTDPSSKPPLPANSINADFLRGILGFPEFPYNNVKPDAFRVPHLTTSICDRPAVFMPKELLDFLRVKQSRGIEGVDRLERLVLEFNDAEIPGVYDEIAGLIPGGRANTLLKFGRPTSSLKAGLVTLRNKWSYTFSVDDYLSLQTFNP